MGVESSFTILPGHHDDDGGGGGGGDGRGNTTRFGLKQSTFIQRIKKILGEYPDNGQIIKVS